MTRLEALKSLAEKVEAGTAEFDWTADYWPRDEGFWLPAASCSGAYLGSPDAAISLHEAVLAGWEWRMSSRGAAAVWTTPSTLQEAEIEDEPARALMLAILKALIAREQNKGGE